MGPAVGLTQPGVLPAAPVQCHHLSPLCRSLQPGFSCPSSPPPCPDPDVSSEESASTVEEQENETPPATSSEAEPPKESEAGDKSVEKPTEEAKKE